MVLNNKSLGLILLSSAVLLSPLNFSVIEPLRLADILILLAIPLLLFYPVKLSTLMVFLSFLALVVASLMAFATRSSSIIFSESIDRLVFVYKYSLIFLIILSVPIVLSTKFGIYVISRLTFLTLMFLGIWGVFYYMMVSAGVWDGLGRINFPGTDGVAESDAHLYSNVLSILTAAYVLYLGDALKHSKVFKFSLLALCLICLWMAGSRNGLVSLLVVFLVYLAHYPFVKMRFAYPKIVTFFIALVGFAFTFIYFNLEAFVRVALSGRMFLLRFEDTSSLVRVQNFYVALDDAFSSSFFFGASFVGASFLWYDSGIGIIIAHFGFFGIFFLLICVILIGFYIFTADCSIKMRFASFSIFIAYFVGCVITEFFLVTRSVLPAIICIMLPLYIYSERRK